MSSQTYVADEIASQPECWARAARLSPAGLPRAGERVAVLGCGTSLFVAQAYASLREGAGLGETDAWPASEFPTTRRYDRVVAISRSGTTTEVLDALAHVAAGTPRAAITADGSTPVLAAAEHPIVLDFADERSVVQTRFATSTLALLRAGLGVDLAPAVADAERMVAAPLPEGVLAREQFTFLGTGWTVGIAREAALKLRESAQAWTEAYPAMEFRHGPISVTDERSVVWIFGAPPAGLTDELAATGGLVVTGDADPMAELILAQRLAVALAARRGLDPDHPRNLSRSVVLNPAGGTWDSLRGEGRR